MKRGLLLIALLVLIPFSNIAISSNAQSNLVFSGITDNSILIVYSEKLSDNSILTITEDGKISQQTLAQGKLTALWTFETNQTITNGQLDFAQQLLAVSYDLGLLVFGMSSKEIVYQHAISNTPDDIDWDSEGNVWVAFYSGSGGSSRRAMEYDQNGFTGYQTEVIGPGFLAFEVLENDEIAFSAMDSKTHIYGQDGLLIRKLTQSNSYLTFSYQDIEGNLLVGSSTGQIYRYNTTTWSSTVLNLGVEEKISYIFQYNSTMYYVGTEMGSIFIVGNSPFIVQQSLLTNSEIIGIYREFGGQLSVLISNPSQCEIAYFDIDSDLDGVSDANDAYPTEPSQSVDTDGDGYGDNLSGVNGDAYPSDSTQHLDSDGDGYGDNPDGMEGDAFPMNPEQWQDSDGDNYGDNSDGMGGDAFPNESSQWNDTDKDGYGDNPEGITPDGCPNQNGFSTLDRYGCVDSDFDKYSDPSSNWTTADGADALPNDITQWLDRDGDGFGENLEPANQPDSCPLIHGVSTKTWQADQSSPTGFSETAMFGCLDTDWDNWADTTDAFPNDPLEWFDGDGDNVGSNSDYDDFEILVSTEQQYCMQAIDNISNVCQGWRDSGYQEYLSRDKAEGEGDLSYSSWLINLEAGILDEEDEGLGSIIKQVTVIGGIAFVSLAALIILISFIVKKKKINALIKMYGVPFEPEEATANDEALEDSAGLSASGGIESDDSWDEEVKEMDFSKQESNDEEMQSSEDISAEQIYDEDNSIEDIAGIDIAADKTPSEEVSAMFEEEEIEKTEDKPTNAPPVPANGLPEGWTMEQWEWYGHEWLMKNGGQ